MEEKKIVLRLTESDADRLEASLETHLRHLHRTAANYLGAESYLDLVFTSRTMASIATILNDLRRAVGESE